MIRQEDVYRIGRIGKPHGVKGEVNFFFDDDVFDRVDAEFLILEIDGILVPFFMEEYRFRSDETALVKFCDIDSQERAAQITNIPVFFPRSLADTDESADLSFAQIVGYTIIDKASGKQVGRILSVDTTTDNPLFCLEDDVLIPVAEEWITVIDNQQSTITMTLPEGLLHLNN